MNKTVPSVVNKLWACCFMKSRFIFILTCTLCNLVRRLRYLCMAPLQHANQFLISHSPIIHRLEQGTDKLPAVRNVHLPAWFWIVLFSIFSFVSTYRPEVYTTEPKSDRFFFKYGFFLSLSLSRSVCVLRTPVFTVWPFRRDVPNWTFTPLSFVPTPIT